MIQIEENCYLINLEEKDKYSVGYRLFEKTIVSMELYSLEGEKYIKITTVPINYKI